MHVAHLSAQTTGDEGWDRFTFSIKLEDFRRTLTEKRLMMCIRFSVEGKEWWDSGVGGGNYNFTFKKYKPVRRQRAMFEVGGDADSPPVRQAALSTPPVPGMRASGFGRATGWNFPGMGSPSISPSKGVLGQSNRPSPPPGPSPDVPAFRGTSFQAPPMPNVHEHLSLKGYCAPSPMSPPKEDLPIIKTPNKDDVESPRDRSVSIVTSDKPATLAPVSQGKGHERRRSWGGEIVDDSQSIWTESTTSDSPPVMSDGGNVRSRDRTDFEKVDPEAPLSPAGHGLDLFTPPSSALSTPPLGNSMQVTPESPSTDSTSLSVTPSPPRSTVVLPEVVIDGSERDRHMEDRANAMQGNTSGIHSPGYKEFVRRSHPALYVSNIELISHGLPYLQVEKFCFFQSRAAISSPVQSRCTTPTGMPPSNRPFNPFGPDYANLATGSQHTTPTGQGLHSDNYFGYQPFSWGRPTSGSSSSSGSASGTPNFGTRGNPTTNFVTIH